MGNGPRIDIDDAFAAAIRSKLPAGSQLDPFDLELAKVKLSIQESTTMGLMGGGTKEVTRGDLEDAIRASYLCEQLIELRGRGRYFPRSPTPNAT